MSDRETVPYDLFIYLHALLVFYAALKKISLYMMTANIITGENLAVQDGKPMATWFLTDLPTYCQRGSQ